MGDWGVGNAATCLRIPQVRRWNSRLRLDFHQEAECMQIMFGFGVW